MCRLTDLTLSDRCATLTTGILGDVPTIYFAIQGSGGKRLPGVKLVRRRFLSSHLNNP